MAELKADVMVVYLVVKLVVLLAELWVVLLAVQLVAA